MAYLKRIFLRNKLIILLLFASLLLRLAFLPKSIILWWDPSVYLGMGKYLFSFGKAGLWEASRPIVLPIILGLLWKLKLSFLFNLLQLFFSLGCVYLVYLIGKDVFNEKIALLSALFLSLSPTFVFFGFLQLTDIPSTFFALLGVYLFIRNRNLLSGLFLGIAFMARFLQLFVFIILFISLVCKKYAHSTLRSKFNLTDNYRRASRGVAPVGDAAPLSLPSRILKVLCMYYRKKNLIKFLFGFSIPVIPYLAFNLIMYSNPLYPFLLQSWMTQHTGWIYNQPLPFYFLGLLKENFLAILSLPAIYFIFKKTNYKKISILLIFILFFLFFTLTKHKEMRFILVFLPYLYLITSLGIFNIFKKIKSRKIVYILSILLLSVWLYLSAAQIEVPKPNDYSVFWSYMAQEEVKSNIWISNPIFIAKSDKKADELIYYPLYNSAKAITYQNTFSKAKHVLIDTCDIMPCPVEDAQCKEETEKLIALLKKNFKAIYENEGGCSQYIFSSLP